MSVAKIGFIMNLAVWIQFFPPYKTCSPSGLKFGQDISLTNDSHRLGIVFNGLQQLWVNPLQKKKNV